MDYCTLFPEGWWAHCCAAHDADYLAQIGKLLADERLLQCVAAAGDGNPASWLIGVVMFAGVGLFGRRFYRKAVEGKDARTG